jgi:cysteinyl-tRNA synthetase
MGLKLHNTLTRTKDDFVPIDPANVRMYVCGPTVYDFAHIGNARPLIVFDVLFRLLRHTYGADHVTYVRNITDVDDKINARAAEEYPHLPLNEAIRLVTERTTAQFHEDVAALGCLPPTVEPRATEYIHRPEAPEDMIRLIARLVESGHAYVAEGHVLFSVPSMPDYGRLSNRTLDEMVAGARVEVAPYKQDPTDFVLWKPSKPGEPAWDSPWGQGRPGWHVECSAMAGALLGPVFDIHGGGIDLVFPHHENEIAQSRCAHGTAVMANTWLHNGFLQVEGEKMSKSLGNFITIRDVLADWPGEVVRLAMLKTHYRQPIDWTLRGLREASETLAKWRSRAILPKEIEFPEGVVDALNDDLNTPRAIAQIHGIAFHERKETTDRAGQARAEARMHGALTLLGLQSVLEEGWLQSKRRSASQVSEATVSAMVLARVAARKAKDFAEADRIRAELETIGVVLKDAKDPETGELVTTWEMKR